MIEADEKFDSGAIIEKNNFYLSGDELNSEIRNIQAIETIKIILKFLKNIQILKERIKGKSTFYRRRFARDSKLNINKTLKKNFNLLRIADNDRYPATLNIKNTYVIKIFKESNKSLIIKYMIKEKMKNKHLSSIKIIDQISNIRKNNKNWMDILKLAFKRSKKRIKNFSQNYRFRSKNFETDKKLNLLNK